MYCHKCGKLIEEDSTFCKHCGTEVFGDKTTNKSFQNLKSLYKRFTSLSATKQILILSYILWLFVWAGVLIICAQSDDFKKAIFLAFIAVFVIPFLVFFIAHVAKLRHLKKKNISKTDEVNRAEMSDKSESLKEHTDQEGRPTISASFIYGKEIERFTLKEFSLLYGKMQVKTTQLDSNMYVFCTFTNNGVETKVYFDKKIGYLSASEIAEHKLELCVVEYEDKHYVLSENNR